MLFDLQVWQMVIETERELAASRAARLGVLRGSLPGAGTARAGSRRPRLAYPRLRRVRWSAPGLVLTWGR